MTLPIYYCMMTKNRLHEVKTCLDRVGPFVDGMVVVDGCSADDSIFYLRNRSDVHFFLHPWNDNFSEQRNNYIKRAREVAGTDDFWMIISDPDELFSVEALYELPNIIDHCEKNGFNMVQFRCRSVTLKGEVRVWQNLDDYYKGLMFRYKPGIKYINSPHETLVMPNGIRPIKVELLYEHIKQEDIIIHRGSRNQYCGGGGPNLGEKNKLWVELKQIVREVYGKDLTWEEYDLQLARGNIDQRIKDWMIKVRQENGWDGSCFVPGQYIHTKNGAKSFLDINNKDTVISMSGKPTKVVLPKEHWFEGKVIKLRGRCSSPVVLTPNHRVLVAERFKCKNKCHDRYCRADCAYLNNGVCKGDIKQVIKWVRADEVKEGKHAFMFPKSKANKNMLKDFSLEKCEFLGWFMAEGDINKNNIRLTVNTNNDPIDHIKNLIYKSYGDDIKIGEYVRESDHTTTLRFAPGKVEAAFYKEVFGHKANNKHVPSFVFDFSEEQIKRFLIGAIGGDGCITREKCRNKVIYSTSSLKMAHDLQFLMTKIGVLPEYSCVEYAKNRYSKKPIYRLQVGGKQLSKMKFLDENIMVNKSNIHTGSRQVFYEDDNFYYLPCTSVKEEDYVGPVYNIETEDNTYLSGFIVHNSEHRECYKLYMRIYHPEEEPEELRGEYIP